MVAAIGLPIYLYNEQNKTAPAKPDQTFIAGDYTFNLHKTARLRGVESYSLVGPKKDGSNGTLYAFVTPVPKPENETIFYIKGNDLRENLTLRVESGNNTPQTVALIYEKAAYPEALAKYVKEITTDCPSLEEKIGSPLSLVYCIKDASGKVELTLAQHKKDDKTVAFDIYDNNSQKIIGKGTLGKQGVLSGQTLGYSINLSEVNPARDITALVGLHITTYRKAQ